MSIERLCAFRLRFSSFEVAVVLHIDVREGRMAVAERTVELGRT